MDIKLDELLKSHHIDYARNAVCNLCKDVTLSNNEKAFIVGMIVSGYKSLIMSDECQCTTTESTDLKRQNK